MMFNLKTWLLNGLKLFHALRDEHLQWLLANQANQITLKHNQLLANQHLEAELRKRTVELEHDINLLKTKQQTDLAMLKTRCKQELTDYQQYLAALDQLKQSIQNSYPQLPVAVAFTIHHHAKHLLNQMWESSDIEQKLLHEMALIRFMATVHEEVRLQREGKNASSLPEETIKLIQQTDL